MRFMKHRWLFNLILLVVLVAGLFVILRPTQTEIDVPGTVPVEPPTEPIKPPTKPVMSTIEPVEPSDEERTLGSFEKIDDFPLYVMTYYGDYGLANYLEVGLTSRQPAWLTDQFWACTTFSTSNPDSDHFLGRNFDWSDHPALLLFTDPPEGYASVSMVDLHYLGFQKDQEPSATAMDAILNAPFLPFDGMNEHGLAVGMMAVPMAEPYFDPNKTTISSLTAIRLMLDYAQDVDEAIIVLGQYNIDFVGGPPLHYLIADKKGNSVVVEFINEEMVLLESKNHWQVSTNFLLSIEEPIESTSTCWRYNTAYETLKDAQGKFSTEQGIALLEAVSQESTIWTALYNQTTGEIYIAVGRDYLHIHEFKLETTR